MSIVRLLTGCEDAPQRTDAYPFRKADFAWPYLMCCLALALGEALGFAASTACSWWPLSLTLLAVCSLIGYGWEISGWHYLSIVLLGFTLSWISESQRAGVLDHCDFSSAPLAADFPVNGGVKQSVEYTSFDSSVDGVSVRVMIRNLESSPPAVGEVWRCRGWLERKERDERTRRMLWVCGRGSFAARIREAPPSSLSRWLRRLRERLAENAGYGLDHDPLAADLDRAMILGLRTNLPRETRQLFADAGTVHVFAISGLHVGIIAWLLVYLLMAVCGFPLRWVVLPLTPLLGLYVLMIGAPPSSVRAALMSLLYFSAPLCFRRSDSLVAWSLTFLVCHVWDPAMLMNVGSLLSFTVMLGILLYVRWASVFNREWLLTPGVSLAAWLSGLAISAHVFERITLGGLFANIFVIPLASLAVVMGFLGAMVGFVCPWLAAHFNNAAALLIRAMGGVSWLSAEIPYANLTVVAWPLWMCFAWYIAIFMTLWLIRSIYLHNRRLF